MNFSFAAPLPSYLTCTLCGSVFDSPVRVSCSHTFCKDCLAVWLEDCRDCPECKKKIIQDLTSADLIASSLINELEVQCSQPLCEWKGKLEILSEHVCPSIN